ncbi:bifunctional tRNA (5-methylaminomethyl-2-thiouridine)(34)-methyltransferase MnmD/FAD-dependent 5-carboxymethylaminomethyl-2-thiouridine(34) oxidoreductase MnmC [Burkholderia plantarii]|uniref:bifunctional tRNA (5-methylaminomethyl-2-thiouridine)(34)-methyltransferase MnmD/FAD-dependent 5-carboxymethylaminomethyl-2-thiouridine(34) oxidoreductase MnmC n=1 Tax=Burkholderia plantarii TaxID=41899 RepID=UPI0018DCC9A3|nr:bifunctional tRNA (5-methylaminomethyl-2-thiouridine)(34)-methyltransferase MnmD/FAD-dependent 5-carboxymethylaminomethyl-2-thiouridine(34) oxidoreductase MnmC [Burkholderia plantarii]MBI0326796.1 bifunctional tRNA (5-methylaminomethyl-2-thiouridine)(34)-methyltransferase MnmD/FAD-dependent 5-carboxymethylaminomethyl-2-thiouridine(34) oxidoreductase MnmC [Burkholderia plantarii]
MTDRIVPASLVFRDDGTLVSPAYGDIYHSAAGALAQAEHVFLRGNGLPERWRGRRCFTIVETGFGIGGNFLATWAAWRADPARGERLHFVSIEKHPFSREDLRTAATRLVAHATIDEKCFASLIDSLVDAWPMLTPGLHRLEFDEGRVVLTLAFGDALALLPSLVLRADAFYLDGFAPAKNAELWSVEVFRALAKLADEAATFATYSSAGDVKRALEAAGFAWRKAGGFAGKRAMLVGEFAPRWKVRRHEPPRAAQVATRDAIVIGAGLAGCALVERLSARGWHVTLIERHARPASEASGNPAGVFHPLIARDDNFGARLSRAGYLYALSRWRALEAAGHDFARSRDGLLQLACDDDEFARMQAAADALAMPESLAVLMSREAAAARLGSEVAHGGWWYPQAGSLDPAALAQAWCAAAGERLTRLAGTEVARLAPREGGGWLALDAAGNTLASAAIAIVANAADAPRLAGLRHAPVQRVRGQLTVLPPGIAPAVTMPAIGDGYLIPFVDGTLLTGATYEPDATDSELRKAGHQENLTRLAALLPRFNAMGDVLDQSGARLDAGTLTGRVAFRCVASDRLPMAGALGDETAAAIDARSLVGAQARDLPRAAGLYGAFGFGSRGFVWASLCAELIASQIEGEPWPVERELAEAIDPARFLLRALRQGRAG